MERRHYIVISVAVICIITIFLGAVYSPARQFNEGDIVVMKLDGRKAMVVNVDCSVWTKCRYQVRLAPTGEVYTDTHIFGADGPLSTEPYTLITVYEYELAPGAIK